MQRIVGILILVGIALGFAFLISEENAPVASQVEDFIVPFTKKFVTGDEITFELPSQPVQSVKSTQVVTVNPEQVETENGTMSTPDVEMVAVDTSFDRQANAQTSVYSIDNKMIVTQGNIADIQGSIIIRDPITNEPIEPRFYKYWLSIECSDLVEFCNFIPVTSRGETDSNGRFSYKWVTSSKTQLALYSVMVLAQSENTSPEGVKYRLEHQMFIEVVQ